MRDISIATETAHDTDSSALVSTQTGSAHTMLAPYYLGRESARARLPIVATAAGASFTGDKLQARQISRRGGDLEVEWERETRRTKLRGHAVVVMEGKLRV